MEKGKINFGWYVVAIVAAVLLIVISLSNNWEPAMNTDADDCKLRIMSFAPSVTEMLFLLGAGDCIVGVTNECNWPAEAKDIENIGGLGKPNIEKILSLEPNIIISSHFSDKGVYDLLSGAGIKLLAVKTTNVEEMFEALLTVGEAVDRKSQAEKLVSRMRGQLAGISRTFEQTPVAERPRVFVEIWYDPVTTVGSSSFIDDVIAKAGGVNAAGEISQPWPRINPEKVVQWDPDVIIPCYMGIGGQTSEQIASRIGWSEISAVKTGRIFGNFPSDLILRPGPRLIDGIDELSRLLYAEKK